MFNAKFVLAALVPLAAAQMGGCNTPMSADSWPEARPLMREAQAYRPPAHDADTPTDQPDASPPKPAGELTLRQAMALALQHNPKLARFGWSVRVAEARMLQAGLWSNPELEAEVEEFGGFDELSGVDALEMSLSLAQTFPIGGDIDRRVEVARREAQLAGWDYEAARLGVLTQVTRRYVDALAAERLLAMRRQALKLAEQVRDATAKRVQAGSAPPVENPRAAVPVVTARVDLQRARRHRDAARRKLSFTWAQQGVSFDRLAGDLDDLGSLVAADDLVERINQNPAVARWSAEIATRIAQRRLAEAEAVPDLTGRVGMKYLNEVDDAALVVGVSLPLPLFDRRQGDIEAARLDTRSARQQKRQTELRLQAMLSDAYARLAGAHDQATGLRREALPAANEAFTATQRAFEQGNLNLLDVLDTERTLIDLRLQYIEALQTYHQAAAEIEGLVGQSLQSFQNTDSRDSNGEPKP